MRSYSVEGIVIKRANLGEADKLVTLFTKTRGKLTLVARGVRKLTSRRAGSLELFNHIKVAVASGRGELDTLTEVQTLATFPAWRRSLGRITLAYQLAEAVDKLTPDHQPQPRIFEILSASLSQISRLGADWKPQIEGWLVEIIRELGYWPKNREFKGDINQYIEIISSRPFHSPQLLSRLK